MNEKFLKAINNQTWWSETMTVTKGHVIIMGGLLFTSGLLLHTVIKAILSVLFIMNLIKMNT